MIHQFPHRILLILKVMMQIVKMLQMKFQVKFIYRRCGTKFVTIG
jgi:hypothetical protein